MVSLLMSKSMSDRDAWFNNYTTAVGPGVYDGWIENMITIPEVVSRTVFYDSNIAFTDGKANVSTGGARTIPNLYETLEGLNNRISAVVNNNTNNNIEGIETIVDNTTSNVIMSAVHNNTLQSLTIDATMILFRFGNGIEYSMKDIFNMIEELRARTFAIKTNIERADITSNYISNKITIADPPGSENDLWIKNYISSQL